MAKLTELQRSQYMVFLEGAQFGIRTAQAIFNGADIDKTEYEDKALTTLVNYLDSLEVPVE